MNIQHEMLFTNKIQQLFVEFMSVPVLVSNIGSARIKNAKITDKIPKRKTNFICGQDIYNISEPGNKNIMRRSLPTSAFTAMHTNTPLREFDPGCIKFFQHGSA